MSPLVRKTLCYLALGFAGGWWWAATGAEATASDTSPVAETIRQTLAAASEARGPRPTEAIRLAEDAIALARAANDPLWLGRSYGELARAVLYSDPVRSIEASERGRRWGRLANDAETVRQSTSILAAGLSVIGDFEQALTYYREAITAAETAGDVRAAAMSYNGLSVAYWRLSDFEEAVSNTLRARSFFEAARLPQFTYYNNHGLLLLEMGHLEQAETYLRQAIDLAQKENVRTSVSLSLSNMGDLYRRRGQLREAEAALEEALAMAREINFPYTEVRSLRHLGRVRAAQGDTARAIELIQQSLAQAQAINDRGEEGDAIAAYVEVCEAAGWYEEALAAYRRQIAHRERFQTDRARARAAMVSVELETREKERELVTLRLRETEQQAIAARERAENLRREAELARERERNAENARGRDLYLWGTLALASVTLILFFAYVRDRQLFRHLQQQKQALEKTHAELKESNDAIVQSLQYAERIQRGMLPSWERLRTGLGADGFFTLFQPREAVAGDFYWYEQIGDDHFLAVADCTGHGVPGAFLSVVGLSLLRETVVNAGFRDPGEALAQLDAGFRRALEHERELNYATRDGMEIALVRFQASSQSLWFAGAGLPLWLVQPTAVGPNEVHRVPGTRFGLGHGAPGGTAWTTHHRTLRPGMRLYLVSDGLADTVNRQRQRFGRERWRQWLEQSAHLPLPEQGARLQQLLVEFRGGVAAYDDVTVVGAAMPTPVVPASSPFTSAAAAGASRAR